MTAPTNPPLFPKTVATFFPVTTGAKTSDTNVTGAIEAFTVPNDGSVKFYRVRRVSTKPLAVVGLTRMKLYAAKVGSPTTLALMRDRLMPAQATFSETVASVETDFGYGASDYADFAPGDKCFVGSGVALATGHQWTILVEVY